MGGLEGGNIKILNKSLLLFQKRAFFTRKKATRTNYALYHFSRLPCKHLLLQNQQWKYQKTVWNMLKVNHKDTRRTQSASFWCFFLPELRHWRHWCHSGVLFASTYYAAAGIQPRKIYSKHLRNFRHLTDLF